MTSVIFAVVLFLTLGDPVFSCGKSGHRDIGKFFEALYLLSYTVKHMLCRNHFALDINLKMVLIFICLNRY